MERRQLRKGDISRINLRSSEFRKDTATICVLRRHETELYLPAWEWRMQYHDNYIPRYCQTFRARLPIDITPLEFTAT